MTLGTILMIGALGLTLYNVWDSWRAQKAAREIVEVLDDRIEKNKEEPVQDTEMPTEEIGGYLYIGELIIPSKNLQLPVMLDWDYQRLKISPCRYSGNYYNDDMVVCAHNYIRHFSPIKWLGPGDKVLFKNVRGETFHYKVSNVETIEPTAIDQMVENSKYNKDIVEEWDLTLFTCNTGGQTRCAVRCIRQKDQ